MSTKIDAPVLDGQFFCLVKIGQLSHLQSLKAGTLRFRSLNYYSAKENIGNGWHDPRETVRGVFQANQIKLTIEGNGKKVVLDSSNGLVKQFYLGFARSNMRVLCFHTLADGIWADNTLDLSDQTAVNRHFKIPEHFKAKFCGDHVWVILDFKEFVSRIKKALLSVDNVPHDIRSGPVSYVDFKNVNGVLADKDIGFVKGLPFSEEKEFRFIATSRESLDDPFELKIGDLSDISTILELDKYNSCTVNYSKMGAD